MVSALKAERLPVERRSFGLITLCRPEKMNPIDHATIKQMQSALDEFCADDHVAAIGITGSGKAFSAGGDMDKYIALQRDPVEFPVFLDDCHAMFTSMAMAPKPIIALVNGIAVAGGLETILACDFAIAALSAKIGDAHLNFGQMGGGGVLALLPRTIGIARARELVFTGRILTAAEALDWGLVNRVVSDDQLLDAGIAIATDMARKSPLALRNAKSVINTGFWNGTDTFAALRLEREVTARYCLTSVDAPEGLAAFSEKRPPCFSGR